MVWRKDGLLTYGTIFVLILFYLFRETSHWLLAAIAFVQIMETLRAKFLYSI